MNVRDITQSHSKNGFIYPFTHFFQCRHMRRANKKDVAYMRLYNPLYSSPNCSLFNYDSIGYDD